MSVRSKNLSSVFYAVSYHPIQAGSINDIDVVPHDNAVYRAQLCSSIGLCLHAMWPAVVFEESLASNCKGLKMSLGGRSVPVQFFGTHDFARVRLEQVKSFLSGLLTDLHSKCKKHSFIEALEEAKSMCGIAPNFIMPYHLQRQGSPGQRMGPTTRRVGNTQVTLSHSLPIPPNVPYNLMGPSEISVSPLDVKTSATSSTTLASGLASADWKWIMMKLPYELRSFYASVFERREAYTTGLGIEKAKIGEIDFASSRRGGERFCFFNVPHQKNGTRFLHQTPPPSRGIGVDTPPPRHPL
ncbi:hypothetical protein V8G54_012405 [Vigna mungo]|uniref:PWWP domain-containing protein n=1 Tax=Vigna mungo TaxID=3915 RepID=A0AAQ3S400_VIGMU